MGFKVNYDEAQDFGAVPDGTYEVVIFNAREDVTQGGAENINFDMIIRNDIDQPRKNSHLFHKLWKAKATGKYNRGMIMYLAKTFGLQDGKDYASFEDFLNDFSGKVAKVQVKNEQSEYNGKTYDNTNIKKFEASAFPQLQHVWKTNNKEEVPDFGPGTSIDINDDDLPF